MDCDFILAPSLIIVDVFQLVFCSLLMVAKVPCNVWKTVLCSGMGVVCSVLHQAAAKAVGAMMVAQGRPKPPSDIGKCRSMSNVWLGSVVIPNSSLVNARASSSRCSVIRSGMWCTIIVYDKSPPIWYFNKFQAVCLLSLRVLTNSLSVR